MGWTLFVWGTGRTPREQLDNLAWARYGFPGRKIKNEELSQTWRKRIPYVFRNWCLRRTQSEVERQTLQTLSWKKAKFEISTDRVLPSGLQPNFLPRHGEAERQSWKRYDWLKRHSRRAGDCCEMSSPGYIWLCISST